ncbi:MAG TPA: PepSY domain-containing protein, partial [Mycobacterium sp.]|nr:PepSY domain-containing protein [Mycobacterium sp.]
GTAGLPGRSSADLRSNTPRGAVIAIGVIATALAVLYPSFGVTLVIVLIAEAIVESRRKNRRPETVVPQSADD